MLADGIARLLHDQGFVDYRPNSAGGDCFLIMLPSTLDECVVITDTGGGAPGPVVADPMVQVRVRGGRDADPTIAADRCRQILDALHGFRGALPDGTFLLSCFAVQSTPIPLGLDDDNRPEFSINFTCQTRVETVPV